MPAIKHPCRPLTVLAPRPSRSEGHIIKPQNIWLDVLGTPCSVEPLNRLIRSLRTRCGHCVCPIEDYAPTAHVNSGQIRNECRTATALLNDVDQTLLRVEGPAILCSQELCGLQQRQDIILVLGLQLQHRTERWSVELGHGDFTATGRENC